MPRMMATAYRKILSSFVSTFLYLWSLLLCYTLLLSHRLWGILSNTPTSIKVEDISYPVVDDGILFGLPQDDLECGLKREGRSLGGKLRIFQASLSVC